MVSPSASSSAKEIAAVSHAPPAQQPAHGTAVAAPHPVIELTHIQKNYLYFHFRRKYLCYSCAMTTRGFVVSLLTINKNRLSKTEYDLKEMQEKIDNSQSDNLLHFRYTHEKQSKIASKTIPYVASKALPPTAAAPAVVAEPLTLISNKPLPALASKIFELMKDNFSLEKCPQIDSEHLLEFILNYLTHECKATSNLNKIVPDFETTLKFDHLTPLVIEHLIMTLEHNANYNESSFHFRGLLTWEQPITDHLLISKNALRGILEVFKGLIQCLEKYKQSLSKECDFVFEQAGKKYIWTPPGNKQFASEQVDKLLVFFNEKLSLFQNLWSKVSDQLYATCMQTSHRQCEYQQLAGDFKQVLAYLKRL